MTLTTEIANSLTAISEASRDDIIGCWFATIDIVLKHIGQESSDGEVFAIAAHQLASLKSTSPVIEELHPEFAIN